MMPRGSQDHTAYDSGWPVTGLCLAKGSEVHELAQDPVTSDQLREARGVSILGCSPCVPTVWPLDQRGHRELGNSRESEDQGLHPALSLILTL